MKKFILIVGILFLLPFGVKAAALSLSPAGGSYNVGDTISVNILLDTQGAPARGVDVRYLNYNPALLEAQDENTGTAGTQILAGTLMGSTMANSADTSAGRVLFSQAFSGSDTFTGAGTLATIRFRILAAGTANVNFDFTPSNTADTNVAGEGIDLLTSVGNAAYILTVPPPPTQFPALSLSPASEQNTAGTIFPVRIYLDTKGRAIDGVDVSLSYDRARLAVVDDSAASGIQITPGSLLSDTTRNDAGRSGQIFFSQTTSDSNTFSGSGVLATVYFKALSEGVAPVTFNSVKGRTNDSNVSLGGADLLDSVANGSYAIIPNGLAPIISNPQPAGVLASPRSVVLGLSTNEAATCRYSSAPSVSYDLMGSRFRASSDGLTHTATLTSGFQPGRNNFYVRCRDKDKIGTTNLSDFLISFDIITDTTAPYVFNPKPNSIFFMPRSLTLGVSTNEAAACRYGTVPGIAYDSMIGTFSSSRDGLTHTEKMSRGFQLGSNNFYVRCKDKANNNANQDDFSISFSLIAPPELSVSLEGLANPSSANITTTILNSGIGTEVATFSDRPDRTGAISLPSTLLLTPGSYDFIIFTPYYLKKKVVNIELTAGGTVQFPALNAGDLNSDGIINSLDWSLMRAVWAKSSKAADINKDRTVNSVDWGYLRKNWLTRGD